MQKQILKYALRQELLNSGIIKKKKKLLKFFKNILKDIKLDKTVYILYLKEYQIQPLFYNKTSMKPSIGNNPSIIDTLQRTAR